MRRNRRMPALITALFTLVALTVGDVATAHTKKWKTRVVARSPLPGEVFGAVRSPKGACRAGRKVRLVHKDGVTGKTTPAGAAVTPRDGSYAIAPKVASAPGDTWVVKVVRKVLRRNARHRHVCRPRRTSIPAAPGTLQVGNDMPRARLQTKQSSELADNRIGAVAETEHVGESVWGTGLKWMRVIVDSHGNWQHVDWETDEYSIDPKEEQVIDELVSNRVKVMLVLDVWHAEDQVVFYKTEEHIAQYVNWVRFMARRFRGRIDYYEILNEPDLNFEAPSGMPVDAYVNLIEQTVPVIREEDPQAKIVVGAIPDTRFDHVRDYMWSLLGSGIMSLVDGFSWHGMYGAAPSDDPRGVRAPEEPQMANYWENYPALVNEIMSFAASNGFEGEYLVEEMIWRTPTEPHESEPSGFTDLSGAKYYARAVIIHLGLNVTTGIALVEEDHFRPRSHAVIRALSTVMAGAEPADMPVVIESAATNIEHYSFAFPDGDKLLALWTDGAAVEDDPGVEATVTLPGVSAEQITGVDVLRGFGQELQSSVEIGDLLIPDLLVTDYPLILRITN